MKKLIIGLLAISPFLAHTQSIVSSGNETIFVRPGTVVYSVNGVALNGTGTNVFSMPQATDLINVAPASNAVLMENSTGTYQVRDVAQGATGKVYATLLYNSDTVSARLDITNQSATGTFNVNVRQIAHFGFNDIPAEWKVTKSNASQADLTNFTFTWSDELEPSELPFKRLFVWNSSINDWEQLPEANTTLDEATNTLTYTGFVGQLNDRRFMIAQARPYILLAGTFTSTVWCPEYESVAQSFTIEAFDLTEDATLFAPANFEISLDANGPYQDSIVFVPVNGDVALTTIYIRIPADAIAANTVNITASSSDAFYSIATPTLSITSIPDVTPPSIQVQNITIYLDTNGEASFETTDIDAGTTDFCNVDLFAFPNQFSCGNLGVNSVIVFAIDNSSNLAFENVDVTVLDTIRPTITAPSNLSLSANATCQATGVVLGTPTTWDNCFGAVVTNNAPSTFPIGTTTVVWTITDVSGNTATANQIVTVTDNTNPTITGPSVVVVNAAAGCVVPNASVNYGTVVNDNCTIASTTNDGPSNYPLGSTTILWTVTDATGNTANLTQIIKVIDGVAPIFASINDTILAANTNCEATGVILSLPSVSENCVIDTLYNDAPTNFPIGTTVVTWTAIDANGNTSTASQNVIVNDLINPTIVCPTPSATSLSVSSGMCGYLVQGIELDPVISDNCGSISASHNFGNALTPSSLSGALLPVGSTNIVWVALDDAGNSSTCSFTVNVVDDELPVFANCPPAILNVGLYSCGNGANWNVPTVSDNCGIVSMTQTSGPTATATLTPGTYSVVYEALDVNGNTATCSFTVNVTNSSLPVLVCPNNITAQSTDNGSCDWTASTTVNPIQAIGNCTSLTWSLLLPDLTTLTGNNSASGAIFPIGTSTLTYTLIDSLSNQVTCQTSITVIDTEAPQISAPVTVSVAANANCVATAVALGTPIFSDNCGTPTVVNNAPATFPIGTTVVTWIATDAAGNSTSTTQDVVVTDQTNPTITAPASVTVSVDANCVSTIASLGTPLTADNCSVASVTNNAPATFPVGTTTVTWTVTDAAGNTATDTQIVIVQDTILPVITNCPQDFSVGTYTGCTSGPSWNAPIASDNCSLSSFSQITGPTSGSNLPLGITTIAYEAIDISGNTNTCSFNITVTNSNAPVIICPTDTTYTTTDPAGCTWISPTNSLSTILAEGNCPNQITWTLLTASGTSLTGSNDASGTVLPTGINTLTYTITDANSNSNSCTTSIGVIELNPPLLIVPADVTVNANASCTATNVVLGTPIASDNCSLLSVTNDAPSTFPLGTTSVNWIATDAAGNTTTLAQSVTVIDITNPTILAPANIVASADTNCFASSIVLGLPTVADNCGINTVTNDAPATFSLGTTTVTWTVTDNSGNTATAVQTVTIIDDQNPTIIPPTDLTLSAVNNCMIFNVNLGTPVTDDNCGIASITNNAPLIFPIGTTTVTWTVTDNSGNTATALQLVVVLDDINPTIIAPLALTVNANASCGAGIANLGIPITSDNCTIASVTNNAPAIFPLGTTTVIWTVTDGAGNTASASQAVIVIDNTNPTITAPANIVVSANANCVASAVALGTPTTADNCGVASVTNNAPAVFPLGTTTVTWTVTDNSGNVSTATQTVTVNDTQAPVVIAPANVVVAANSSCVAFNVALGTPTATDNCTITSITSNAPAVFQLGTTTVTWTVTDNSGNVTTATQLVTVNENTNPTIVAPLALTVNANASCGAVISNLGTPITSDNCTVASVINNAPAIFPLGTTTVTWTVEDGAGNTATATQDVTVIDNTNPTITAPANIVVSANANCAATGVALGTPTTSDNCGVATVTNNAPATFPLGTTTVTWTVTDNNGNVSTATQTVTVNDTQAPVVTAPADVVVSANGSCVAFNVALGTPTATDNCTITSVTNNAPTVFQLGNTTVTWTVTDNNGNVTSVTQLVTVNDNTNPTIVAPLALTVNANASCGAVITNLGTPATADNCTVATVTNNAPATFPLGTTTVTWTVTDGAGNTATATQTVNVIDNTNPTVAAPANIVVSANANCAATGVALGTPTTSDNCGVATVTNNAPATFPLGTTTVTWTVTDNNGNVSTATQTVTVNDTQAPNVTAPADVVVNTNFGCEAIGVQLGSPVVTDNCAVESIINNAPLIYPLGNTLVTWTVNDVAGNVTTVTQLVTVEDNVLPVIIAPLDMEVVSNSGCDATGIDLGIATTSDNCGVATVINDAPAIFLAGTTLVTWTVTDNSGNTATALQTVKVLDLVAPTPLLNNITITLSTDGVALLDASMIDAGSFDNCGPVFFQLSQTEFSCDDLGVNSVVVVVTDNFGNFTTSAVTITVEASGIDSDFDGIDDSCDPDVKEVITIPTGFTPDGDGINDFFVIPGIEENSTVSLQIFNRYGNVVYTNENYQNDWDGTSSKSGLDLPDGTYFYVLEINAVQTKSGYVYINRVH